MILSENSQNFTNSKNIFTQIKHGSLHGKNFGILDFFGFEINKTNRFEQLVSNYCSEKLHQVFVVHKLEFHEKQ